MRQFIILYSIGLILLQSSCRRDINCYSPQQGTNIELHFDWSELIEAQGEAPSGVSVIIYPRNGENPINLRSTNIDYITTTLPYGEYDILVFNQIPSDFTNLLFSGLDSFATAEVSTATRQVETSQEEVAHTPEYLAAATVTNFTVSEMCKETEGCRVSSWETLSTQILNLKPTLVVRRIKFRANVTGAHNIQQINGYVKGLAESYNFAKRTSSEENVMHTFSTGWQIEETTRSSSSTAISQIFLSFGAPSDDYSTSAKSEVDGTVGISFLLRDNTTLVESGDLHLGDRTSAAEENQSHDLLIEVNPSHLPITLPYVSPTDPDPETDSEGDGFDVDINDWGEEDKFEIVFK